LDLDSPDRTAKTEDGTEDDGTDDWYLQTKALHMP